MNPQSRQKGWPRVVVAPDSFKGTLTAAEVAGAIAEGVERGGGEAVQVPIGDGGEGTMAALVAALGGELHTATVSDPLGRPIAARYALLDDRTGVVETAEASGLTRVGEDERDPVHASTRGTGELIAAAAGDADHVIVTVGGSATTDGGAGAVAALAERGIRPRLTVLCDVRTAWEDAPRLFGPQKGADAEAIEELEGRLRELAESAPRDPRGVPMTGCAGGLSGGLWAHLGAELVPGAAYVLDALEFDRLARGAEAVVTGEGRLDGQTAEGKAVSEVAKRCAALGVPCHAVVGTVDPSVGDRWDLPLADVTEASTLAELRAAGERLARSLRAAAGPAP